MKIKEIHYYFPKKIISNNFLDKKYPKWKVPHLFNFSGVKKRYIAKENETSLDMVVSLIKKILIKNKNFLNKNRWHNFLHSVTKLFSTLKLFYITGLV